MSNMTMAEAAAAEPQIPERSHANFCSELPDLSNEYLSLVHIDSQRAEIELQRRKQDLQDDIRLLTEATQHIRAENDPHLYQNQTAAREPDQEAPLLPPKQNKVPKTVNLNECMNLSLDSMLTPDTATLEPTSSSASPPMSVASGQHVRFNDDIDIAAQLEPLVPVRVTAGYGQDTASQTCAGPTTAAPSAPASIRHRRSPPTFKGFKRKK
jgi:hypothetical protein